MINFKGNTSDEKRVEGNMAPWLRAAITGATIGFALWFFGYEILDPRNPQVTETMARTRNLALAALTMAGALTGVTVHIYGAEIGKKARER